MLQQILKQWLWLLAFSLSFACGSPAAAPTASTPAGDVKSLQLGATPWVPFTGQEGQPRVADYLVESALQKAGYEVKTTIVADGTLTPALEQGRFHGSTAMWPSPDRERFLVYSKPYLENRLLLVGRKGSDVSAKSFADLSGKRLAIVEGYAYGAELEAVKGISFVKVQNAQENLRAVVSGRADYCLLDALVVEFLFEQHLKEASEQLEVSATPLVRRSLHFAIRRDIPNAARIIEDFDKVVSVMMRDGTYNTALQLAWLSADVDGDGRAELVSQGSHVGTAPPARSYQVFQNTAAVPTSGAQREEQSYYVNGRTYGSWQEIPEELKLQPGANPVGSGHPQIKLIEW